MTRSCTHIAGLPAQVTSTGFLAKRIRRPSALPTPAELHAGNVRDDDTQTPMTAAESARVLADIDRAIALAEAAP